MSHGLEKENVDIMTIIKVTQDHIDRGRRYDKKECPVALAMMDQGFEDVSVGYGGFAFFTEKKQRYAMELGPNMSRYIYAFDIGRNVGPYTFEILSVSKMDIEGDVKWSAMKNITEKNMRSIIGTIE